MPTPPSAADGDALAQLRLGACVQAVDVVLAVGEGVRRRREELDELVVLAAEAAADLRAGEPKVSPLDGKIGDVLAYFCALSFSAWLAAAHRLTIHSPFQDQRPQDQEVGVSDYRFETTGGGGGGDAGAEGGEEDVIIFKIFKLLNHECVSF